MTKKPRDLNFGELEKIEEDRGKMGSYIDQYNVQRCCNCGQSVAKRKKLFDFLMFSGGLKMREYAVRNNKQTVNIREIAAILSKGEYCNLNHLVRFGLAYKNDTMGRGEYGVPRKRWSDFLKGERTVAKGFIDDPTLHNGAEREMTEERIHVSEVPNIQSILESTGGKFTEYTWNEDFE